VKSGYHLTAMAEVLAPDDLVEVEPSDGGSAPLTGGARLGRYELLLPVAKGGMARVWAARQHGHRGFTKLVAIKTILPHLAMDAEFEKMFLDEARIAAGVHHPNVCEIYELGEEGKTLYLAMEWVAGDSLARILKASGKLVAIDPRVAARIVADACAGLNAAHNLTDDDGRPLNVVHRDVSPHNILVSADGVVKVADFGVAKALGQLHDQTSAGQLKGKIAYMAPEQVTGGHMDRRSDLFSLGCCLYEATTGAQPFKGDGDHQVMHKLLKGEMKPPGEIVRGYPAELEGIVMRALATQPMQRFPNAERMKVALEEWIARSGPVVGQAQVAQIVRARLGAVLDKRKERIRVAMAAPAERPPQSASEPPAQGLTPSYQGASGIKPAGQMFPGPAVGPAPSIRQPPPVPPVRGMMSTMRLDDGPATRVAHTPTPPPAGIGGVPTPLMTPIVPPYAQPFAPPSSAPSSGPASGHMPVAGAMAGPMSGPMSSGPVGSSPMGSGPFPSGPVTIPPEVPASLPPPKPMQYVVASAIGIAVAAVIGVAGYFVVRNARAPHDAPAAAATAPKATPPVASVSAAPAATTPAAAPAPTVAADEIGFKVYPESAVLVVRGQELGKDVRVVARPSPGAKVEVTVRAEGFKEQTFVLDDATTSPIDVWLVDVAQASAQPSADPGPPGGQGAQSGADPASGGAIVPRRPKNDPIPANPY
jgi:serine/threonine-protein kinase